jgi:UDP-N-acetyl-D-glucosamine dehydrogenase
VPCTPRELRAADAAVIVTDHSAFDWGRIVRHSRLVLDTRNATAGVRGRPSAKGKVVPL